MSNGPKATLVEETLTDNSKVYNLVITEGDQIVILPCIGEREGMALLDAIGSLALIETNDGR